MRSDLLHVRLNPPLVTASITPSEVTEGERPERLQVGPEPGEHLVGVDGREVAGVIHCAAEEAPCVVFVVDDEAEWLHAGQDEGGDERQPSR